MPEIDLQNPDITFLHERGGLTAAHWEEVLKFVTPDSKMARYGRAVIDGRIEDINFRHREYLGRSGWDKLLKRLAEQDRSQLKSQRRFFWQSTKEQQPNLLSDPTSSEIWLYGLLEVRAVYSLQDYLIDVESSLGPPWPAGDFYDGYSEYHWDHQDQAWHELKHQRIPLYRIREADPDLHYDGEWVYDESIVDRGPLHMVAPRALTDKLLLTEKDTSTLKPTGKYEDLVNQLLELAKTDPNEVRSRVIVKAKYFTDLWKRRFGIVLGETETAALNSYHINMDDNKTIGNSFQKIFANHFGISPFILFRTFYKDDLLWGKPKFQRQFSLFVTQREALATLNSRENMSGKTLKSGGYVFKPYELLLEGEVETSDNLPILTSIGYLEKEI